MAPSPARPCTPRSPNNVCSHPGHTDLDRPHRQRRRQVHATRLAARQDARRRRDRRRRRTRHGRRPRPSAGRRAVALRRDGLGGSHSEAGQFGVDGAAAASCKPCHAVRSPPSCPKSLATSRTSAAATFSASSAAASPECPRGISTQSLIRVDSDLRRSRSSRHWRSTSPMERTSRAYSVSEKSASGAYCRSLLRESWTTRSIAIAQSCRSIYRPLIRLQNTVEPGVAGHRCG